MGNIAFGNKYFILSKFSSIPKTAKIEKDRADLIKELENHIAFDNSDELKDFKGLDSYLKSKEHKELTGSIAAKKQQEKEKKDKFGKQKKSKSFKNYFKFKASQKLIDHYNFKDSKELSDFIELENLVTNASFNKNIDKLKNDISGCTSKENELSKLEKSKAVKDHLKNSEDKPSSEVKQYIKLKEEVNSQEFITQKSDAVKELNNLLSKEKDYNTKKKSSQIKRFFKFQKSQKLKTFEAFDQSKELADHIALEEYLNSTDYAELQRSLEEQDKTENDKSKKHEEFTKSAPYKSWLSIKDSNKFDDLKSWEITFEENFDDKKPDADKWMTRYLWGDKLLNDSYALETDKAFPTDGNNLEAGNSILKIITRKEKVNGKVWKQPFGFMPQDFEYTTGLISTAKSFKQKYGKFEAKIKVNYAKPVNYNFWMASEKMLPHVDILKLEKKKTKVDMAHLTGDITSDKKPEITAADFSGLDVSQDFFIYTFEWSKDKMIWKINDVVVNKQTKSIPSEEMYLVFSSSITGKADGGGLPASMEVDWVRCFKRI